MRLPFRIRSRIPSRRARLTIAATLLLAGFVMSCGRSVDERDAVHVLTADDEVNPVLERYIDRGIDEAERTDAKAVVIQLDTPGGLVTSMEEIVQRIQSSKVPVIVYVAPSGGKAASAGTFITMSAHVAAMAPGTRIGAAHPVDATRWRHRGRSRRRRSRTTRRRTLAHRRRARAQRRMGRGRGARQRLGIDDEAVELNVVDFSATRPRRTAAAVRRPHGHRERRRQRASNGVTEAPIVHNDMTFIEQLAADPQRSEHRVPAAEPRRAGTAGRAASSRARSRPACSVRSR